MLPEMDDKNADIEGMAARALADKGLIPELLDGLKSRNETYRYNCHKVLLVISEEHGEALYPSWDHFVERLGSDNSYHKMSAALLIAGLVKVDTEDKFEDIFDKYYGLLDDKSMIVAYYVASSSARIVRAKPHLRGRITGKLLNIDKTHHPAGRRELIKTGVIEALDECMADSADRSNIVEFVRKQQDSESPKTRKAARAFLKKWGDG
jgi:hypothetical protein